MVIDNKILDNLTAQAKASPRLRMNLNFHQSLDEKCHRFLNAVEPGANIPIHRHPEKEESFVVLRGRIRVITYNDDGTIIENMVLNPSEGRYGVNVGKNVWHTVEALEPGSVIFECKEGPYVPHEEEGTLVSDIIMPLIGAVTGGLSFTEWKWVIREAVMDGEAVVKPELALTWGNFVQVVFDFIIIAFCIFMVVKGMNKLKKKEEEQAPAAPAEPSEDIKLLTEIRDLLKK